MTNKFMLEVENKLHGFHTRLKELHYSSPSFNIHKLTDSFDEELQEFDDAIMENSQALWGFIYPGDLDPELPDAMNFSDLLIDIRGLLIGIKKEAGDDLMWSGIINRVDDFIETVNSYIYQLKIATGEARE